MGNTLPSVFSPVDLTEPITEDRVRVACQRGSPLDRALQSFEIKKLVRDFNALGADISLRDGKQQPKPDDELCSDIQKMIDVDPSKVCMMKKGEKYDKSKLVAMVNSINQRFGSNILIFKNGDERQGLRGVHEICDDAYMISGLIKRRLLDDRKYVKEGLMKKIDELKKERDLIDMHYQELISDKDETMEYDEMQNALIKLEKQKTAFNMSMSKKLDFLQKNVLNLGDVIIERTNTTMPTLQKAVDGMQTHVGFFGGGDPIIQIDGLAAVALSLGSLAHHAKSCLKDLGELDSDVNVDAEMKNIATGQTNNIKIIIEKLGDKLLKARDPKDRQKWQSCLRTFTDKYPDLAREQAGTYVVKGLVDGVKKDE
jgi:hypothetical protein